MLDSHCSVRFESHLPLSSVGLTAPSETANMTLKVVMLGNSVGTDLGGSSKYFSENLEDRGEERFLVSNGWTWVSRSLAKGRFGFKVALVPRVAKGEPNRLDGTEDDDVGQFYSYLLLTWCVLPPP